MPRDRLQCTVRERAPSREADPIDCTWGCFYVPSIWGSHRANTYFGLRTRDPRSPLFGMMWYEQPEILQRPHIRHWCDQGDGLKEYGWYSADGRTFGRQNLTDHYAQLSVDWVNNGEAWSARIRIEPKTRHSLILYMTAQVIEMSKFRLGHHMRDLITGRTELFGDINLTLSVKNEQEIMHTALTWDDDVHLDQLNELILMNTRALESDIGLVYQLGQQKPFEEGRFVAVQFNIQAVTEMEIAFRQVELFQNYSDIELKMAKMSLSNMLGSIGYWYGYNKVSAGVMGAYGPHELLSAVPSRSYFPRGFLWDEGFHNMLIRKFDSELSLEIVVSWLNTMSEDGWIPREMILDEEAEARVPAEFVVQRTSVANPPSIFYVVDQMLSDEKKHGAVLSGIYPRLEAWYRWLLRSQSGKKKGTFSLFSKYRSPSIDIDQTTDFCGCRPGGPKPYPWGSSFLKYRSPSIDIDQITVRENSRKYPDFFYLPENFSPGVMAVAEHESEVRF
ncbi:unnamed protein product [Heligmosomoides polygyrus]|uniref:Mannosyl-oligosaccharide glucosidase n=1 Tax=Heligmosomoides polygyrus TaxID=6339 RepID=A0A183GTJ6_HELPZ|nr:unnamed protein product [Heligmosomoides polygyrus]